MSVPSLYYHKTDFLEVMDSNPTGPFVFTNIVHPIVDSPVCVFHSLQVWVYWKGVV